MIPPLEDKYESCHTCQYGRICYDWKQSMPNAIKRPSGNFCPVDGSEIMEVVGLHEETDLHFLT